VSKCAQHLRAAQITGTEMKRRSGIEGGGHVAGRNDSGHQHIDAQGDPRCRAPPTTTQRCKRTY
jgi:hypothetical protein